MICDEIYAASADPDVFHSCLKLKPDSKRVVTLWGASKDMGMSGARMGSR